MKTFGNLKIWTLKEAKAAGCTYRLTNNYFLPGERRLLNIVIDDMDRAGIKHRLVENILPKWEDIHHANFDMAVQVWRTEPKGLKIVEGRPAKRKLCKLNQIKQGPNYDLDKAKAV